MLERSSGNDNVGVIIVAKRAGGRIPGFIKKPPLYILIQHTMMKRRNRRVGVKAKEVEEAEN